MLLRVFFCSATVVARKRIMHRGYLCIEQEFAPMNHFFRAFRNLIPLYQWNSCFTNQQLKRPDNRDDSKLSSLPKAVTNYCWCRDSVAIQPFQGYKSRSEVIFSAWSTLASGIFQIAMSLARTLSLRRIMSDLADAFCAHVQLGVHTMWPRTEVYMHIAEVSAAVGRANA